MKISVFFDHVLQAREQSGKALEELLAGVRKSGIEAVEINLAYLESHPETIAMLREANLKVSCIYEFYEMGVKDQSEKISRHINAAVGVGAGKILVVPGFLQGAEAEEMQRNIVEPSSVEKWFAGNPAILGMKQGLLDSVALGSKKGITVTVEDFDDVHSPLSGMYGIQWFLKEVPGLKYTLDMGNYLFYGENVMDAWELLKEKVAHVHCKDRQPQSNASVQTGTGYMPIKQLVEALKAQGYDDYLAVEHFDVEGQEQCMAGSAKYLKDLL